MAVYDGQFWSEISGTGFDFNTRGSPRTGFRLQYAKETLTRVYFAYFKIYLILISGPVNPNGANQISRRDDNQN